MKNTACTMLCTSEMYISLLSDERSCCANVFVAFDLFLYMYVLGRTRRTLNPLSEDGEDAGSASYRKQKP